MTADRFPPATTSAVSAVGTAHYAAKPLSADRVAPVRARYTAPAVLHVPSSGGSSRRLDVEFVEFGPTGAEISAAESLGLGARVRLAAAFPNRVGDRQVELEATVRWSRLVPAAQMVLARFSFRSGLGFEALTPAQEADLLAAVFHLEIVRRRSR